jgi:hypothetical protein
VNGEPTTIEYDEDTRTNRIRVPTSSIREAVTVSVELEEERPAVLRARARLRRMQGLLGAVPDDRSLQDIVVAQKDPVLLEALLAICGVALHAKHESWYMSKGPETLYISNASGLVDDDTFFVTLEDMSGDGKRVVLSKTITVGGSSLVALCEAPAPEPPKDSNRTCQVRLDFNVQSQPLSISKTLTYRASS